MARKEYDTIVRKNGKIYEVDDACIALKWRNFSGENGYEPGKRSFLWCIQDEETAQYLKDEGFTNVKRKEGEDGSVYWQLEIKVKYNEYGGPKIRVISNGKRVNITEETAKTLDNISISRIDFDIAPHVDERKGTQTAYLRGARIVQSESVSRFDRNDDDYEVIDEVQY